MNEPESFWTVERIKEWHVKNERIAQLKVEIEALREGLMQIREMRRRIPLANCIPVIDALLIESDNAES